MSEELIVRHCAPTLAGMKTGSMFNCYVTPDDDMNASIRHLNQRLVPKGVRMIPLRVTENRALIYLYRPKCLRRDFSEQPVQRILEQFGYVSEKPALCIMRLIGKLREQEEFPHEIGLFLGYPAEDVMGFIENRASNSKCTGCWKVYGDEEKAGRLFAQYKKCTDIYCEQWKNGKSIDRLAGESLV